MKLRIQLSDLSKMTSYRANKNEAVLLFSYLLIVARLSYRVQLQETGNIETSKSPEYRRKKGAKWAKTCKKLG